MRKCKCLFHHIQSFSFSATLLYCLSGAFVVSAADYSLFLRVKIFIEIAFSFLEILINFL